MTQKTLNTANKTPAFLWKMANALLWTITSWVCYKGVLFRCLPGCSFTTSRSILAALLFTCMLVESAFTRQKDDELRVGHGLFCAYGIYTAVAYRPIFPRRIFFFLLATGVLTTAVAGYIMSRPIGPGSPRRYRRILAIRLKKTAAAVCMVAAVSSAAFLAVLGAGRLFRNSLFKAEVKPTTTADIAEQTIKNNLDTLSLLDEERWSALSVEQKLNVLQVVANIERRYLGLATELTVGAANLEQLEEEIQTVSGYCEETHEILVDIDALLGADPWDLVNSIAHEARHCYQYRLTEMYLATKNADKNLLLFREARVSAFIDEFAHYENGKDDFWGYYNQELERDAREYAAEREEDDYRSQINAYTNTEVDEE